MTDSDIKLKTFETEESCSPIHWLNQTTLPYFGILISCYSLKTLCRTMAGEVVFKNSADKIWR